MMQRSVCVLAVVYLAACSVPPAFSTDNQRHCKADADGIDGIKLGDSAEKVLRRYSNAYEVKDMSRTGAAREIRVTTKDNPHAWSIFTFEPTNSVMMIDSTFDCVTPEGVRVGKSLGDAIRAYGAPLLEPTDTGYFVFFDRPKGLGFLLRNTDISKQLRNIPDDVLSDEQTKRILSHSGARLDAIRVVSTQ
jgi:hypothetical protein